MEMLLYAAGVFLFGLVMFWAGAKCGAVYTKEQILGIMEECEGSENFR